MMKRTVSVLGISVVALLGCSSSTGGGSGNESGGSCASFEGTFQGSYTCTDGSSGSRTSEVSQKGCSMQVTHVEEGTTDVWQINGNTATIQINEDGAVGHCSVTLHGNSYTQSCQYSVDGQKVTCSGDGTRVSGGAGGSGSGGEPGSGGYPGSGGSGSGAEPGSGGYPGAGGSVGSGCSMDWTDTYSCNQCMKSSCCNQMLACAPGTACAALIECGNAYCDPVTADCLQTYCGEELQMGGQDLLDMLDCNTSSCNDCS